MQESWGWVSRTGGGAFRCGFVPSVLEFQLRALAQLRLEQLLLCCLPIVLLACEVVQPLDVCAACHTRRHGATLT